jgi:hypothetical protein
MRRRSRMEKQNMQRQMDMESHRNGRKRIIGWEWIAVAAIAYTLYTKYKHQPQNDNQSQGEDAGEADTNQQTKGKTKKESTTTNRIQVQEIKGTSRTGFNEKLAQNEENHIEENQNRMERKEVEEEDDSNAELIPIRPIRYHDSNIVEDIIDIPSSIAQDDTDPFQSTLSMHRDHEYVQTRSTRVKKTVDYSK